MKKWYSMALKNDKFSSKFFLNCTLKSIWCLIIIYFWDKWSLVKGIKIQEEKGKCYYSWKFTSLNGLYFSQFSYLCLKLIFSLTIQINKKIKANFYSKQDRKFILRSKQWKKLYMKPILNAFSSSAYILVKNLTQNGH